ncbi:MAG: DUF2800 domain-containing protein [Oscillospiraceae bacterium]|nr:DUF2800 domain-containing protein [Oscillospiraceae bacterium]
MPPEQHAFLSASSSGRWTRCPPSARLCENIPDPGSEYATEGTCAHALCEHKLKTALGLPSEDPTEDLSYHDAEMERCSDEYLSYILGLISSAKEVCKDPIVLVEQQLDFSRYVPEGFGTGDCLIVSDGTLYVIDFKYGKGVEVSADRNTQMMCYALGALNLFDGIYDIDTVCMVIFQPRIGNISPYTVSREELLAWGDETLAPAAKLAFEGKGEFACGDWCRFCRAKAICRERARTNMEMAQYEFRDAALLSDREVTEILGKTDDLISWANDIREYALKAAVNGKHWDGYKLVEGRSVRRYTDEKAVADAVTAAGYDPWEKPKILSITAMSGKLGQKRFNEILGDLVYKPPGKPTLVPDSDKRPAMTNATDDFKEEF